MSVESVTPSESPGERRLLEPEGLQEIAGELAPVLQQIDESRERVAALSKSKDSAVVDGLIDVQHVFHSNAIEGNSLTSSETEEVLRGATIDGRPLKDVLEARNLKWALTEARRLANQAAPFDQKALLVLHELVLKDILDAEAGRFRKVQRIIGGNPIEPPEAVLIQDYMDEFWRWMNRSGGLHPVLRGAVAHWWLARIHPFYDGNGRVARLVLYLLLVRGGYRLGPIVLKEDRLKYYDLLAKADQGDLSDFCEFVAQAVLRSLRQFERQLASQSRAERSLGTIIGKVKADLDRQELILYDMWKLGMEAIRAEFGRAAQEITAQLEGRIKLEVRDYGVLSFEEWRQLAARARIRDQWFFEISIKKLTNAVRYVLWFSPSPAIVTQKLQLGQAVGLNVSRKGPSEWIKLAGPGKPHLRHIVMVHGEYYQHVWIDEDAPLNVAVRSTDPRTIASDFFQEALELEFSS